MENVGDGEARRRARKRGHGEGTVYQRKDGRWIAELMVGRRPDGKRDVRTVSAPTRAEVQRKLSALLAQKLGALQRLYAPVRSSPVSARSSPSATAPVDS